MPVKLIYETHATTVDNETGIATGWLPGEGPRPGWAAGRAPRGRS
jgi:alpha-ribazole phosphatase/probable phosphoglycerate mutase